MPKVNRNKPTRAKSSESEYSLMEFMREFPDDATCLDWLWRNRHSQDGEHAHCPKCKAKRVFKRYGTSQQRQSWTCTACGHHMHPTAGTIFHKSATSLHLWFYAMYLMTSTRCGISAKQMERELGVTYKTAWRMCKMIRTELMVPDDAPLSGKVEMDEMYVGGKNRRGSKKGRPILGMTHKTAVFGMVERGGRVVARTVPDVRRTTLLPIVKEKVLAKSLVFTDEYHPYNPLKKMGYPHKRIRHGAKVYVSGDIHTNTIEGFWSLVKRGIGGVYHSVSAKHLQSYLSEYAWRYNRRNDERAKFDQLLHAAAATTAAA
jgi:transposase-like protein